MTVNGLSASAGRRADRPAILGSRGKSADAFENLAPAAVSGPTVLSRMQRPCRGPNARSRRSNRRVAGPGRAPGRSRSISTTDTAVERHRRCEPALVAPKNLSASWAPGPPLAVAANAGRGGGRAAALVRAPARMPTAPSVHRAAAAVDRRAADTSDHISPLEG